MEMNKSNIMKKMNTLINKTERHHNVSVSQDTNVKMNLTQLSNSRPILAAGGTLGGLALGRYLCGGVLGGVGMVVGGPVVAGLGYEAGVWFGTIAGAACGKKGANLLLDIFHYEGESFVEGEKQLHIKSERTRQK